MLENPPPIREEYDIVTVGAGVSGLFATYRILNDETTKNAKIGLFEMQDRIGGRLWSVKFKGSQTPMELGGMRYIEEIHTLLDFYLKKLNVPILDFQMKGNPMQTYLLKAFLRNDHYRKNEWDDLQKQGQKLHTAYRI